MSFLVARFPRLKACRSVILASLALTGSLLADDPKLGDVDQDGAVTVRDMARLQAGLNGVVALSPLETALADATNDGSMEALSFFPRSGMVRKKSAGFPVERRKSLVNSIMSFGPTIMFCSSWL